MRFHRMLSCRVRGCLMFDIGCADTCVAYPDFWRPFFGWYLWMADREFGGITGDLAGYFLQVFELAALTVLTAAYWFPAC